MAAARLFITTLLLSAALMAVMAQSVEPIWLSPPLVGSSYSPQYTEQRVWLNISTGAGTRYSQPIVAMDSKSTLWILFGIAVDEVSELQDFNVWNYDPKTDLYRWVAGPGSTRADPHYAGELRVPSPRNHPGGTVSHTPGSIDHNDNIWFMGIAELWMFNTTSYNFTRMKGSTNELSPVFGTVGQPADDVTPGATYDGCLVVDSLNNLWQIAGRSYIESGNFNQIWHFNTTSYQWTFIGGNITADVPTRYNPDPYYGSRIEQGCDIDDNDRVWLFGGVGNYKLYNDVWSYDTRTRQWQLEFESDSVMPVVANATRFDAGNHPAAGELTSFIDRKDGTLMLVSAYLAANDLWLFHKSLKQWKLVYGDPFTYNEHGNFSHYRKPGSVMPGLMTHGSAHGLNTDGNVFIFGGADGTAVPINCIWRIPPNHCASSTTSNCSSNARCITEAIGYSCECNDGFEGDGITCVDSAAPSTSPLSPSNEPLAFPTPLTSSQPSATPHRNTHVSCGVIVKSSLLFVILSSLLFSLFD